MNVDLIAGYVWAASVGCEIRELLSPSWESRGCSGGPLGYSQIGEVPRLEAHFVELLIGME
jgi:hypothetical protein